MYMYMCTSVAQQPGTCTSLYPTCRLRTYIHVYVPFLCDAGCRDQEDEWQCHVWICVVL